jgi:hypothetical protein
MFARNAARFQLPRTRVAQQAATVPRAGHRRSFSSSARQLKETTPTPAASTSSSFSLASVALGAVAGLAGGYALYSTLDAGDAPKEPKFGSRDEVRKAIAELFHQFDSQNVLTEPDVGRIPAVATQNTDWCAANSPIWLFYQLVPWYVIVFSCG